MTRFEQLAGAVKDELVQGDIVHVHWTAPVTDAATEVEARQKLDAFRELLDHMAARRIRLLWTVHNEIAHDTPYYRVECDLAMALAHHASLIIQLHEHTAEAVARSYHLPPEKLVTLRHASYLGLYPDAHTEAGARERLGIPVGTPTVGFVGRVRKYKGLGTLFAAVGQAASEIDGLTLLLAGKTDQAELGAIESSLPRNVDIVRHSTFVPDEELGTWLRASNVVVLPYQRVLNSGSALLAATFDTPCIIPDDAPLAKVYRDEPWVRVYETQGDQAANLAAAIKGAIWANGHAQQAARRFARSYTPFDMSRDYLRILDRFAPEMAS